MDRLKILITDDDSVSRALIKKILEKEGHIVLQAENGRDAWDRFRENRVNLLVTDWVMPEMDGLELCRKIRGLKLDYYVYIIMITANDRLNEAVEGLESGADDYLTKPFHPQELIARIRTGCRIKKLEDSYKLTNRDLESKKNKLEQLYSRLSKAAEETKNAYMELNQVFNVSSDGRWVIDTDFRVVRINDGFLRITGRSRETVAGRKCYDIFPNPLCRTAECPMNRILKGGEYFEHDIETALIDNTTVPFILTASPLRSVDGLLSGIVVNLKNISARRHAEALQEAKIKAEASNMAKSEFLANMSHEIRTPLNGIIGVTELIMDSTENREHRELLQTVLNEADALLRLINDILDFSRIEAGKLELEKIPFDLNSMIHDIAVITFTNAAEKGLKFILKTDDNLPSLLMGDPGRLRQILNNLLGNALKFTHEGEITLTIEPVTRVDDMVTLRFTIKDTGIGIPKDRQKNILERFTQADSSTTRNYGGSGLGTTISKQLAEMMGGKIGLESIEGKGSSFWFTSCFTINPEPLKRDEIRIEELKGLSALIVNSNDFRSRELADDLTSWGMTTMESNKTKDPVETLMELDRAKNSPDLILIDINMKGRDGFELAERIRSVNALKEIPIILITSVGKQGDGTLCRKIGINAYLTRPFNSEVLSGVIAMTVQSTSGSGQGPHTVITRHSVTEQFKKPVRILLAEDYLTSRMVAIKHLEGAGFEVDSAENGKIAVDMAQKTEYDLILMDIQMPLMGGFEATRLIREGGKDNSSEGMEKHPVIIAMTAHAMKGYSDVCLKEGFDDYISKPLKRQDLLAMVNKWLIKYSSYSSSKTEACRNNRNKTAGNGTNNEGSAEIVSPMNFDMMVEEFQGDEDSLLEIVNDFIHDIKTQIVTIGQAISLNNAEVIRKEAHAVKGGALNVSAEPLSTVARELEMAGKAGNLEKANELFAALRHEVSRLEMFLKDKEKKIPTKQTGGRQI